MPLLGAGRSTPAANRAFDLVGADGRRLPQYATIAGWAPPRWHRTITPGGFNVGFTLIFLYLAVAASPLPWKCAPQIKLALDSWSQKEDGVEISSD